MRFRTLGILSCLLAACAQPALAQTKLLRFPDIHGDRVAFTYGGDLWTAPAVGGTALRLTAHPGLELFAKFSPDGQWIAFTGQYDGDEQVYVIPATGGVPRQLTFYPAGPVGAPRHGYENQVMGWTPDGKQILFRSGREADGVVAQSALFTVPLGGGPARKLPMPQAGAGTYSPEGTKVLYSPQFRDFRHWKRYEGGRAQDLFVFDLKTQDQKVVAHSKRTERDPMWIGGAVYFSSDRDGTMNLFTADPSTDKVKQLTFNKTWDVRWASSDRASRIVYELNGELRVFDVKAGKDTPIAITVPTDGGASRASRLAVDRWMEGFALSPKGERALFVARGDVFTAPVEKGPTRNLTNTSGAHDKGARWSPDGRKIAFISDMSGEDQLYLMDQDGKGKAEALTTDLKIFIQGLEWSPDGKRIALVDQKGTIHVVTVADRKRVQAAKDPLGRTGDLAWSPDGQYLAFSLSNTNATRSLHIWGAADGKLHRVTGELFGTNTPAWDADGRTLYFLSNRDYSPQMSNLEFDFAGTRSTGIYAISLRKEGPHPFPPESDEVSLGSEKKPEAAGPVVVRIDWEGLDQRAARVPVPADNLGGLEAVKGFLLYTKNPPQMYAGGGPGGTSLWIFDLKKRQETELVPQVQGWTLSADGNKLMFRAGMGAAGGYFLMDAKPGSKDRKTIGTRELYQDHVPAQEWTQIYDEAWRRFRDTFYVKNMHGVDWARLREQYRPWLAYVTHRSDLTYVITELISELNIGHTYTEGGDYLVPERARVGLPGATLVLDEKAGLFRIGKIFQGHNEEPRYRSPLTEVGVDAREGDYILAIDGAELKGNVDPYSLLRNKTNPITLTLNDKPGQEGARQVTYRPIDSEAPLRYLDFVLHARETVDRASGGKVGYMHIPDMGAPGMYEFIKWYYPQIRKEGLVVDVRNNGGGNISQMILERLSKKLLGTRFGGASDFPGTYPSTVFHGHMAALINETSASDGDIFPHYFRVSGLGPLIGKRTWGGVVGGGNTPLIDGSSVFIPASGTNSATGEWIIEGEGVHPDIEVENTPKDMLAGKDAQLERGIAEVMKKMASEPRKLPSRPRDPVKGK
jgi:tricorn protease